MTTQFWINDPNILLNKNHILEFWPTPIMCFEQKLNAITRLVILLTILGYVVTMSPRLLFVGLITLAAIVILYNTKKPKISKNTLENFKSMVDNSISHTSENIAPFLKSNYQMGTKKNPLSNVLLTDIMDNPERKSAPPSFNPDVDEAITNSTKQGVQYLNPGIKNTNKQLFGDMYNNFELDQSNRSFFSTANTKVCNDQGAFAEYLYGNMPSGKSSGPDGALARVQDNYRYTLY